MYKSRRRRLLSLLPFLVIGLGILGIFYPTVSSFLNGKSTTRAVQSYDDTVWKLVEAQRKAVLDEARAYNRALLEKNGFGAPITEEGQDRERSEEYNRLLNLNGDGVMGYLTLTRLDETVAIYHGTSESVLQSGIGHIEGTSLPVGGESTHAALSGHRGLPNKQLFTDLDQMRLGDVFYISVVNETLAYEVDQILTVLPTEMEYLAAEEGKDYVTLVTCTPYGVNSHRLLVRGRRIPYEQAQEITAETEPEPAAPTHTNKELFIGLYVLAVFFAVRYIIFDGKRYSITGGKVRRQ